MKTRWLATVVEEWFEPNVNHCATILSAVILRFEVPSSRPVEEWLQPILNHLAVARASELPPSRCARRDCRLSDCAAAGTVLW
jgi:hypothetical protein